MENSIIGANTMQIIILQNCSSYLSLFLKVCIVPPLAYPMTSQILAYLLWIFGLGFYLGYQSSLSCSLS